MKDFTVYVCGLWMSVILLSDFLLFSKGCPVASPYCYTVYDTEVTWMEAEYACASQGGELAVWSPSLQENVGGLTEDTYWIQDNIFQAASEDASDWKWVNDESITDPLSPPSAERRCGFLKIDPAATAETPIARIEWAPCIDSTFGAICRADHGLDCKLSDKGTEYVGEQSVTGSGDKCLAWTEKSLVSTWKFPDVSPRAAGSNCRNVDGDPNGPFCYKEDDPQQYAYCSQVRHCSIRKGVNDVLGGGCFSEEITSDDIICDLDMCYIVLPASKFQSKTWTDALKCCSRNKGSLLDSIPTEHMLREVFFNSSLEGPVNLWIGATNQPWRWMFLDQKDLNGLTLCPRLDTTKPNDSQVDQCYYKKPYICQKENIPTTTRPTTVTSPTTTTTTTTTTTDSSENGGQGKGGKRGKGDDDNDDDDDGFGLYIGIGVGVAILIIIIVLVILVVCIIKTKRKTNTLKDQRRMGSPPSSPTSQVFFNNGFVPDGHPGTAPGRSNSDPNGLSPPRPITEVRENTANEEHIYSVAW